MTITELLRQIEDIGYDDEGRDWPVKVWSDTLGMYVNIDGISLDVVNRWPEEPFQYLSINVL